MVVSVLALLLFGPDRLPKMMRQAGRFMREVQNTSHSFIAEMERAADTADSPRFPPRETVTYNHEEPGSYESAPQPEYEPEPEPEPEREPELDLDPKPEVSAATPPNDATTK